MKEKEASFRKWRVLRRASQELTTSEVSVEKKDDSIRETYHRHTRGTHPREEESKSCQFVAHTLLIHVSGLIFPSWGSMTFFSQEKAVS